jgi:hypothetical protein
MRNPEGSLSSLSQGRSLRIESPSPRGRTLSWSERRVLTYDWWASRRDCICSLSQVEWKALDPQRRVSLIAGLLMCMSDW